MNDRADWDWQGLARRVGVALGALAAENVFIIEVRGTDRYVQCLRGPAGQIRAEVVSNVNLGPRDVLGVAQIDALRERGWTPPDEAQGTNFHRLETGPHAAERAGRFLVEALTEVLGVASPLDLRYDAFTKDGRVIELPILRLARMDRRPEARFPAAPSVLARWTYLLDNLPEDLGGGYITGEFLLLADGRLFWRTATSSTGAQDGREMTTWEASAWELDEEWTPSSDVDGVVEHLTRRGYDLYPPTPIPVDGRSAGPFPVSPEPAGDPLHSAT